jgi:hypothetical protein
MTRFAGTAREGRSRAGEPDLGGPHADPGFDPLVAERKSASVRETPRHVGRSRDATGHHLAAENR